MVFKKPKSAVSPGRYQLPKEMVDAFKRERVVHGIGDAARDLDVKRLTVTDITKRAKMARNTFYELFDNREDALRYAVAAGNRRLRDAIDRAADQDGGWEKRTKAALRELLAEVAAAPGLAELCLAQGSSVEQPQAIPFDPALIETLAGILRAGRPERSQPGPGPRLEELLACGILSVIAKRLREGDIGGLPNLATELFELVSLLFPTELGSLAGLPEQDRSRLL
jgi:AcrR family transcriptional regulator